MLNQFSRTELLVGKDGIENLNKAKVAIFGIGVAFFGIGTFAQVNSITSAVDLTFKIYIYA